MKNEILTYESAQEELQEIVRDLQSETVRIDELSSKIERAHALIRFCRERLRAIETDVNKLGDTV